MCIHLINARHGKVKAHMERGVNCLTLYFLRRMVSYRYTHIRQGDESSAEQTLLPSTGDAGVY